MTRRAVQLAAGFAEGDAISLHARRLADVFRGLGFEPAIYAPDNRIAPGAREACRPLSTFTTEDSDVVLLHYSIESEATAAFLRSAGTRVMVYHNITPPDFFPAFDTGLAGQLDEGRRRLPGVASAAQAVWAVSDFNAGELRKLGIANVRTFPLLFSADDLPPPDPRIAERFRAPMRNLLAVGRIAPNKCIEELILAFAWYNRFIEPFSRLLLVGSEQSCPRYYAMLRMLAGELALDNVCFEGSASPAGLAGYFRIADVFVSASRHEGFCLPLIEAMHSGVPVIARATGGTPEAMGNAGVLFEDLEASELAVLIDRVASDAGLRNGILASQRKRLDALRARNPAGELRALLDEIGARPE